LGREKKGKFEETKVRGVLEAPIKVLSSRIYREKSLPQAKRREVGIEEGTKRR